MDTHPVRRALRRRLLTLTTALVAAAALAPIASAADLIQLAGEDPVRFDGAVSYDRLFLDGVVRFGSDTTITASEVTIGPDAQLQLCWVDNATPNGLNDACVNGRNLTIASAGPIAISPALDLTGGNTAVPRAGGSLVLRGTRVSVGGDVNTSGQTGAPSGAVTVESAGAVFLQTITAPGAAVIVRGGGGVDLNAVATNTENFTFVSEAGRSPIGGPVELTSTAGNVNVAGTIATAGRDGSATFGDNGGHAGALAITGGDVHLFGDVFTDGGASQNGYAGLTGAIAIAARGALATGRISAPGSNGILGAGPGGAITLTAAGALSTGAIFSSGASARPGGSPGGALSVNGGSVALGPMDLRGGSASDNAVAANGAPGGSLTVQSPGGVTLASISARGGDPRLTGMGGKGGAVDVHGDKVATSTIDVSANSGAADGGSVRLQGATALSVGGTITAVAIGGNDTQRTGGSGGPVTIIAAKGPLTLVGQIRTMGGAGDSGTAQGANGGNGGAVELVAKSVANAVGIDTSGGSGGTANTGGVRGNGGNGGTVRIWSQLRALSTLGIVETAGGDAGQAQTGGGTNGASGIQTEEYAPTEPTFTGATRTFTFNPHSPDAEAYRLIATPAGGAAAVIGQTTAASAVVPVATPCVAITYGVVAFKSALAWETDPVTSAPFTFDPSKTQKCTDAPELNLSAKAIKRSLKQLKKAKWKLRVTATTDGIGSATAQLTVSTKKTKKHKAKTVKVAAASLALTKTGPVTFEFLLPAKYRKAGAFSVSFATKAPIGAKSWSDSLGVIVKQSPLGKKHSKSHQKGKK